MSSFQLPAIALRTFCLVLLLAIRVTHISAAEAPQIPNKFSAYIGGFMGASYSVELHDGALSYTIYEKGHMNPKQKTITPTESQWREFRQTLDDLRIWNWHTDYPTNVVVDGTQWSLDIAYADRALHAHGDNNYPDDTGKPNGDTKSSKAFDRYSGAVQKLLGGEAFQ